MPPLLDSIPQPPFGSSPLARPSGNPGAAANGAAMVQEAVRMMEKALPEIPPGHPLHKALLTSISSLSKHAPPQSASPGVGLMALKQLLAQMQRQSPMNPLLAGAGGGGAPPGVSAPPPAPPPEAGGAGAPPPA